MKNMTKWGIALLVLGVFGLIFGATADSNELSRMYSSDFGKAYAEFVPYFMSGSGLVCIGVGIYFIVVGNKKIQKMWAKILDVNKANVIVEFKDGTRKTISNIYCIPVVAGDEGIIGLKGNVLAEFNRQTNFL